jgi:hypothetical protein
MRLSRVAATIAAVAIVSGCGVTHHGAAAVTHPAPAVASPMASSPPVASPRATLTPSTSPRATSAPVTPRSAADPAMVWLESPGGQAQVRFNDDVDVLAAALETESLSPTVANHLVFEADARVVRAQASKILATPALLPTVSQAAYQRMLNDFITVANLLQPGPGYGTTAQDTAAWNAALIASNITVS